MAQDLSPSHPLTPPLTKEEWLDWLRLLRSRRVGVSTFYRLMGLHGSAAAALEVLPEVAAAAGVKDYAACPMHVAEAEWDAGMRAGAHPIAICGADYPALLSEISDAPPILWSLGNADLLSRPTISLVGARNASSLGTRMARRLALDLAEAGFLVTSGLARGIDTAVHKAALDAPDGATAAVLAGGVDVAYPEENAVLTQEIGERGVLLSEQPMHTAPRARHFPVRNRIVAGMAQAVIVIEAASKSGSLITARAALDYGREVMAVPGHPFDARGSGCNMLIRDGAALVRGAEDVIAALATPRLRESRADSTKPSTPQQQKSDSIDIRALHAEILNRLSPVPTTEDSLIRDLGVGQALVMSELVILELDGLVRREAGGMVAKVV